MTDIDTAITRFRDAAIRKGSEGGPDDDSLYGQLTRAYHTIMTFGAAGHARFSLLANDPSPEVRAWASSQLLADGDTDMISVLNDLAAMPGLIGMNASMVLREHGAGTLGSPFPNPAHGG